MATEKAYKEQLKDKTAAPIIVAVLDSGVDDQHEDLKDVMWTNRGEIPNNGIDDDKNGYVDDVYGWNFLGGKDGRIITKETSEKTRLYARYRDYFSKKDTNNLSKNDKKTFEVFKKIKSEIDAERADTEQKIMQLRFSETLVLEALDPIKTALGNRKPTKENIEALPDTSDMKMTIGKQLLLGAIEDGEEIESIDEFKKMVKEQIKEELEGLEAKFEHETNPDSKVRAEIVGDDPYNSYERNYGNNKTSDLNGHGTHVAGIIAASRKNNIGMYGVANNVRIMSVRCVPDGDERDKDVANAIIYAVDNGASVINMSFGKGYNWDKEAVDKAVKYARSKDVLLVHAAGNSGQNNDVTDNFPNSSIEKRGWFSPKRHANWIEVGALNWKGGQDRAASFSNFGKSTVDLFAPGVDLTSTTPNSNYQSFSGTSMASPVVAGVAALIRSYYPELSAAQVKECIVKSAQVKKEKVKRPGDGVLVDFTSLSITGGVVNANEALKIASTMKGKRKKSVPVYNSGNSGNGSRV